MSRPRYDTSTMQHREKRELPSKNSNRNREQNLGVKTRGRPKMIILLDWVMRREYNKLMETAGQRDEWRHWTCEPA